MKLSVLLATISAVFVGSASAAPLCVSGGTMASYEALGNGGCTIGDKLFSNFLYGSTVGGVGVAVPDTAVSLTPVGAGTFNPSPGIIFSSAGWALSASAQDSFIDSSILFTVTVLSGQKIMEAGSLTLSSFSVGGTGVGDITETINPSGIQLQVDTNGPFVAHGSIPNTNTVSVIKDLFLYVPAGTSGSGSVQVNSFEEDFSQIPEPAGSALVGSGLLAIGFWRRRAGRRS